MSTPSRVAGGALPVTRLPGGLARPLPRRRGDRDFFPLPMLDADSRYRGGARHHAAEARRKAALNTNDALTALNWLVDSSQPSPATARRGRLGPCTAPDPLQEEVQGYVGSLLSEFTTSLEGCGAGETPDAALHELLRGRAVYGDGQSAGTLASFVLENVSLPDDVSGCPQLASSENGDISHYIVKAPEAMLQPLDLLSEMDPHALIYWDPILKHNNRKYRQLIQHLHGKHLLRYTRRPREMAGIFFVRKKGSNKIRLIVDARRANRHFRRPPHVNLCTAEGISRFEVEIPDHIDPYSVEGETMVANIVAALGILDVRDCFHRLEMPPWLSPYFCFWPVKAKDVGLTGEALDGETLGAMDHVYPMCRCLPMGFSWALFLAQRFNEQVASRCPFLSESTIFHDRSEPVILRPETGGSTGKSKRHYVYVDNVGALGPTREYATSAQIELSKYFDDIGLLTHDQDVITQSGAVLGNTVDCQNSLSRSLPERVRRVRRAIASILQRGRAQGWILELVIGHCTFIGLANRPLLCVFHSVYRFIAASYSRCSVLWDSVRDELAVFAALAPLARSSWKIPWNERVISTDASEEGYGVTQAHFPRSLVASAGRVREVLRFRLRPGASARDSALGNAAKHMSDHLDPSEPNVPLNDVIAFCGDSANPMGTDVFKDPDDYSFDLKQSTDLKDGEASNTWGDIVNGNVWEHVDDFPEVPTSITHDGKWRVSLRGDWKDVEGIVHLEARALVKSIRRLALTVFGTKIRQLFLVDNMGVCLCFARSRAHDFKLLVLIRRFSAYCLARGIVPAIRWIPSEFNTADVPSRTRDLKKGGSLGVGANGVQWIRDDVLPNFPNIFNNDGLYSEGGQDVVSPSVPFSTDPRAADTGSSPYREPDPGSEFDRAGDEARAHSSTEFADLDARRHTWCGGEVQRHHLAAELGRDCGWRGGSTSGPRLDLQARRAVPSSASGTAAFITVPSFGGGTAAVRGGSWPALSSSVTRRQ